MILSPQAVYPSAKAAGISDASVISYGTINIDTRVKAYSKKTKLDTVITSAIITNKTIYMPTYLAVPLPYTFKNSVFLLLEIFHT